MHFAYNSRASTLLYNYLSNQKDDGIWMIPVNVCHLLPAVFIKSGKPFEIIDVSPKTYALDEEKVLQKLVENDNKYAGVLFVRNYGEEKDNSPFFRKLKERSPCLKIIDDACLSFPDFDEQILKEVDLQLFSTGYSKPVDIGYGGFAKLHKTLLENKNTDYCEKALKKMNRDYLDAVKHSKIINPELFKTSWLINENIDEIAYQARVKAHLKKALTHKKEINEVYYNTLSTEFIEEHLSTNWRFNIRLSNPKYVLDKIFKKGLFASQHYYPINKIFGHSSCPNWEKIYTNMLNLFNDNRFSIDDAERCSKLINKYAKAINE